MNDKVLKQISKAVEDAVDKKINGKLVGIHAEIVENQKLQVLAHDDLKKQIKDLGEKVAPWENSRTWMRQLFKGLKYLGIPAASAYGIYKFFSIFK